MSPRRHRPNADLIRALMIEGSRPADHLRGGFGGRIRTLQALAREAAAQLEVWGRPKAARKAQTADLFKE